MITVKKVSIALLYVAISFVLTTSCSSDEGGGEKPKAEFQVEVTTYAASEDDNSSKMRSNRATMEADGNVYKIKFATGDVLLVWGKDTNNKYFHGPLTLKSGSGTTSGTFSGTLTVESGGSTTPLESYSEINAMLAPSDWQSKGYNLNGTTHAYEHSFTAPYQIKSSLNELVPYLPIAKKSYANKSFTLKLNCGIIHARWSGIAASKEVTINAFNQKDEAGRVNYGGTKMSANSDGMLEFYMPVSLAHGYYFNLVETSGGKNYYYDQTHNSAASGNVYNLIRTFLDNKSGQVTAVSGTTYVGSFTGSLAVPDKATISLDGVTISSSSYAPITCSGDATIKVYGSSTLTSTAANKPGMQPGESGKTLTITGKGNLSVTGGSYAAGIGAGGGTTCGNITIAGGTITATGGNSGAGIGAGAVVNTVPSQCGNITINGGSVTATGGTGAAGIGTGNASKCGTITIGTGASYVEMRRQETAASSGDDSCYYILGRADGSSTCGTITVDGQNNSSGFLIIKSFTNYSSTYDDSDNRLWWKLTKK